MRSSIIRIFLSVANANAKAADEQRVAIALWRLLYVYAN